MTSMNFAVLHRLRTSTSACLVIHSLFANREQRMYNALVESLKPQDVVVVLKLCADAARDSSGAGRLLLPSMAVLGMEVGLSSSEVHAAIRRSRASGLLGRLRLRGGERRRHSLATESRFTATPQQHCHSRVPRARSEICISSKARRTNSRSSHLLCRTTAR